MWGGLACSLLDLRDFQLPPFNLSFCILFCETQLKLLLPGMNTLVLLGVIFCVFYGRGVVLDTMFSSAGLQL